VDEIFTSTNWRDCTRNMLMNNERILYVERTENERVCYTVTFDNGQTLELDEPTGEMFTRQLQELIRPSPPVQYVRTENRYPQPNPHRRRAMRPTELDRCGL